MATYCSNNTNKLSPQERITRNNRINCCSNNTNKLSPQEPFSFFKLYSFRSNNTNKLSPQELQKKSNSSTNVQIIQINLVLKNTYSASYLIVSVQIIQINLVLKNTTP